MAATDLVRLDEVKAHLEIPPSSSVKDAALASLIVGVSLQLENWCRVPLIQRTIVERHATWNDRILRLWRYPVVSVTSIKDDANNEILAADYYLNKTEGTLRHFSSWPVPYDTNGNIGEWIVEFVAGRWTSTSTTPGDAKLACHMQIAHLLPRKSPGIASLSTGTLSLSFRDPGDELLLPEVRAIMARYKGNHI